MLQLKDLLLNHAQEIAQTDNRRLRIMVSGGKNLGKSTFCRYLMNSLLNKYSKVAYIETDIGQTEFTPSGALSLNILTSPIFGPPFTHLQKPVSSRFIGLTSPFNHPYYYLACINSLFDEYESMFSDESDLVPLIINTHGWTTGIGLEIIGKITLRAIPEHIVQFRGQHVSSVVDFGSIVNSSPDKDKFAGCQVHALNGASQTRPRGKAHEARELQLRSYFHNSLQSYHKSKWKNIRIRALFDVIPFSQVFYAINASLVGLCADDRTYSFQSSEEETFIKQNELPILLAEVPICRCLGLGIVKSIDMLSKTNELITPLSTDEMHKVNTLLPGRLAIPSEILLKNVNGDVPYHVSSQLSEEGSGSGAMAVNYKRILT
eukprot:TRINITY_DN6621_c0_g1_i1.p1 TRINITY_DN6621_c0_g1~~TRINITY_DN6621_c0_g1_i1.p1  ORF type:complete len:376 (+),score=69.37 TRINITY_DN6621_c0_g1_i1:506-1633(+)